MTLEFNIHSITPVEESGSITPSGTKVITENGEYNVTSYATASVNVEGTAPTLTELTVTPSTTSQTITPIEDGFSTVTVEAVTASIDSDIVAGNIKSGVNILGVNGSVTELVGETKTITANGTYAPTVGNGFTSVSVNVEPTLGTKTITVNGSYTASSESLDGFSSVSVNVAGTTPTGTYTITTNGTYDVTDYASADVNVSGGGGSSTKRGDWLVPPEYTALDAETMSIYNTYLPANAVGIYIDRDLLGSNRYLFLSQSGVTYKAYTKNGEKTISVASDIDSFVSEIPLSSGENWLVITASNNVGTVDTQQIPYSGSSTIAPYFMGQYNAVKYACVMSNNALGGFPQMGCYRNLEEYHPLATGVIKLAGTDLVSFADSRSLKYISSASEYSYDSSFSSWGNIISNGNVLQRLGYLPSLPYGADFSTATTYDWNFSTNTSQVGGAYLRGGAILRSMYITIPKVNITMNGTPSSITNTGVNLTADNWDYITLHAPTGSGKTITINAYNNTQMGATNKAALQSKGWTVTVI